MAPTKASQFDVFRPIATTSYYDWLVYNTTPLYDRSSLGSVEENFRTVAAVWFDHESVDTFVCHYPLEYVDIYPHDRYSSSTRYEMDDLFRVFLLKELYGWNHETALVEYLQQRPTLCEHLEFQFIPGQLTLWRSWHQRFTDELKETVETVTRTILIKAAQAGVSIPREPSNKLIRHRTKDEATIDDRSLLNRAEEITEHISRIVYPVFTLDRGDGCEIHENAFWDLQTYLGLRENLAANEGAQGSVYESLRERTPLGHTHRHHLRDLSVDEEREMYRQEVRRLINRVAETEEFYRAGIVAIDITEAEPFTGDRAGHEDEIIGTKEQSDEYAYQWATIQLVGNAVPSVLDARPVQKGDSRVDIVRDLLDSAQQYAIMDNVLMNRMFDSQHILEEIDQRGLHYVVPKQMQTSEKAQAKRLLKWNQDRYVTDRNLLLDNDERHKTTLVYRCRDNSERTDYRQYSVFITNGDPSLLREYDYRWEIESGYKSIKRFMAATTAKNFVLRFFYFAFACLLCPIWRGVDLLV